jgi:Predicted helicase
LLNNDGDFVGFDVVIGNPPYGATISKMELNLLYPKYGSLGINQLLKDSYFIFCLFGLKDILKSQGYLSYIIPNTWKLIEAAKTFRQSLMGEFHFLGIDEFKTKVFDEATVDCDIIFIQKNLLIEYDIKVQLRNGDSIEGVKIFIKKQFIKAAVFQFLNHGNSRKSAQ